MRSRWSRLAGAVVMVAGAAAGLALPAAPRALAENNGLAVSAPLMGWSSWGFLRNDPTGAKVQAEAAALKSSGLAARGYDYVNLDDFWYQCPGSQGPNVDGNGRWVTDTSKFPASGSTNGIQVVANYVHNLGLKFGLYVTPGLSKQGGPKNTPIQGTSAPPAQLATTTGENNYNCGGMTGINYSAAGAQQFVNS